MAQIDKLVRSEAIPFAGAFTVREAAVLLRATTPPPNTSLWQWKRRHDKFIVPTTQHLSQWIRLGMDWEKPIKVSSKDRAIAFPDLVRLRMIALLRSRGISYKQILVAEEYVRKLRGIRQPFITEEMWTAGSDVFVVFSEKLIAASKHGQLVFESMGEFLKPANHGLVFFADGSPALWKPSLAVVIDPEVQFGAPCLENTRIETRTIWSLNLAGDSEDSLAEAFNLPLDQVRYAIGWEQLLSNAS